MEEKESIITIGLLDFLDFPFITEELTDKSNGENLLCLSLYPMVINSISFGSKFGIYLI
jgi:hypothetical protein